MKNHTGNNGIHKARGEANGGGCYIVAAVFAVIVILIIIAVNTHTGR